MKKTALVIGSNGLVGSYLVQKLLEKNQFQLVTVLVRKSYFAPHPKLKEVIFDFENEGTMESLEPVNHIFCCLGTTIKKAGSKDQFRFVDYDLPLRFARWAETTHAKSFSIVTALGANSNSSIFYNKVKGDIEDELKKMTIPIIQIFQPSLIMGPRPEFRLGEKIGKIFMSLINPFLVGSLRKYRGIHAQIIAKGLIDHLEKSDNGISVFMSDKI